MRSWRFGREKRAVSPVIAVILMVAITVVLAAVLYVTVQRLANQNTEGLETVGVRLTLEEDGWVISILSGRIYNDTNTVQWYVVDTTGQLATNVTLKFFNLGDPEWIEAGDSFFIEDHNRDFRGYTFVLKSKDAIVIEQHLND